MIATDRRLESIGNFGPLAGFDNMLSKENERWWNLKSIAIKFIVWTLIVNVLVAASMYFIPMLISTDMKEKMANSSDELTRNMVISGKLDFTPDNVAGLGRSVFFSIAGFTMFIGAVIYAHDAILKERESGTAAWLLSKPVSRKAVVLSKILGISFGMITIILLVQGLITYLMCSFVQGRPLPLIPFFGGIGVLGIGLLFYLVLAMMLGALSLSRVITLGVPIILNLMGTFILSTIKGQGIIDLLGYLMPWNITGYATLIAAENPMALDHYWPWPIIATVFLIIVFVLVAVDRFERLEF